MPKMSESTAVMPADPVESGDGLGLGWFFGHPGRSDGCLPFASHVVPRSY